MSMSSEAPAVHALPAVLSVQEFQDVMRVSKTTALSMIREGKVRSVRHGKVIRIPRAAVLELLGETTPAA